MVVAQATVEPTYGPLGLALLKGGKTPQQALKSLLATDPRPWVRQVMMIDSRGRASAHTGKGCLPESGHVVGRGFCVQADFAVATRVWRSAASAFRRARGTLAERLVAGLEGGEQASSGARRGGAPRSAVLVVVNAAPTNTPWEGRLLDMRVDSDEAPLKELKRLLKVQEAYGHAATGDELLSRGEVDRAMKEFSRAVQLSPESSELRLWLAIGMLQQGESREALSTMRGALGSGQDWKALLRELKSRGIVRGQAAQRPPE